MSTVPPTITLDQEINPWEAQSARFEFAARKLNLDPGLWKVLSTPFREIIVHFPVALDNGNIEMFTGFGCNTRWPADRPRAASGMRRM
jgi:glutamate dehydrogenase (NAD(P)+)